jgi:hypothetical protein
MMTNPSIGSLVETSRGGFLKGSWQRRSDDQAAKKEARPLCEPGGEFGEEKGEIDGTA